MTRWCGPRRIAHRGGGTLAPENTLAALRAGLAHGYRAVEFDVMLTADDVPVLMHDPAFGRTIAGRGALATITWAELATRDAGAWLDPRFAGERVPRYVDAAAFCRAHDVWANVEIKPSRGTEAKTGRIVGETTVALVDDGLPVASVLFSSFSAVALGAARAAAPDVPRALLARRLSADVLAAARALGCVGVHVDERRLDPAAIASLHAAGFAALAYTVDDPDRVRALEADGVDGLFTNRIDLVPFA